MIAAQRYEGASTLFGPQTLNAYRQEFAKITKYLAKGEQAPEGKKPVNYLNDIVI